MRLFLAGDVMTGRGVDQILPYPGEPDLYEGYMKSALGYVSLAERASGPIPRPVAFDYVWGDALAELERRRPNARLINLETAVTSAGEPEPKGINYRMHPDNAPVISAAGIDCCVLANNHVLDWGAPGLLETLRTLEGMDVTTVGAGRNADEAGRPALLQVPDGRVVVFALASPTAGVPASWAAGDEHAGVNYLPNLDMETAARIAARMRRYARPGDILVVSLHWGGNWGYEVPGAQRRFARRLIDEAGASIVWGHSSHHPKGIEVHNGGLILYGCGDFLNDYEGIGGYEHYRGDLVLMYLPVVDPSERALRRLTLVPFRIRRLRLERAGAGDTRWLADMLDREGAQFDTRVEIEEDDTLSLVWDEMLC
ncbi:MAG TPA: CapA family protein [Arenicellales bacterium]|nr:CapA family protein [Arenicellales bacterium]